MFVSTGRYTRERTGTDFNYQFSQLVASAAERSYTRSDRQKSGKKPAPLFQRALANNTSSLQVLRNYVSLPSVDLRGVFAIGSVYRHDDTPTARSINIIASVNGSDIKYRSRSGGFWRRSLRGSLCFHSHARASVSLDPHR